MDLIRRNDTLRAKLPLLAGPGLDEGPDAAIEAAEDVPDDRLRLIFTCCHPALAPEARTALTLRLLGGLSTAEIARAVPVPEATMAPRRVPARPAARSARGRLPDLQRGSHGNLGTGPGQDGPPRRGHPARPPACRSDAGRAGGACPARPDAAYRVPPRGPHGRWREPSAARRPGPRAVGPGPRRGRPGTCPPLPARRPPGPVPDPGRHQRRAFRRRDRGRHRLAADPVTV